MEVKKSRECFLDLLRIVASFFVIVNHTNSTIFLNSAPSNTVWYISLSYFFVSKIAVPIFFMISGYLLLSKIDSWSKVLKRFLRIACTLLVCAVLYSLYYNIVTKSITSPSVILMDIFNVYKYSPTNSFWYLYAYLGIILMLPFLQKMAQNMSKKDYHIFFLISGVFYGIMPILSHYSYRAEYHTEFRLPIFTSFICMLFVGQYFSRFGVKKTKSGFILSAVTFVLMVALNVILTYFEYYKNSESYLFFDNIRFLPILLQSVACFYMLSFVNFGEKSAATVSFVGGCTFGIYLISDMTIDLFNPLYTSMCNVMPSLIAVIIFEIIVFTVGFIVTLLLKKLPFIKKYI